MKIVVLDGYTLNPGDLSWQELGALGELTVYDRTATADILPRIGDAEIVFTNKTPLSKEILSACPRLRYIGVLATGYNVVDVEAAQQRKITVTNIPTYGTTAVAQYVFALLLEICHHVGAHDQAVKAGDWSKQPDFCFWKYPLIELSGKTMGIVGMGRIGKATARIASSLGMQVVAYDQFPNSLSKEAVFQYVDWDTLLQQSDVITLHCPLTPATQGIINKRTIARMKTGAILLNTARGPLVAEHDIAEALCQEKLYAYGADVATIEPIPADSPLLTAPRCILTPHIAWASLESRQRLMRIAVDNLASFLAGVPKNTVTD